MGPGPARVRRAGGRPGPQPGPTLPRGLALPLLVPSLLHGLGQGAAAPVVVLLALEHGASVPQAGLVAATAGLGMLVGDVPSGWIISCLGERRAVAASTLIGVAGAVLSALATRPDLIAVGVALVGLATAVSMVARQNSVVEVVAYSHRGRALSAVAASMRAGLLLGPFLGAALVAAAGPEGGLWLQAAALAVAGALMMCVPDATPRGPGGEGVTMVAVRHARVLTRVGSGAMVLGVCRTCRTAVLPLWAAHIGLDAVATSVVFGIGGAVDLLVSLPAGRALDTIGRVPVAVASTTVFAAGALLLPLANGAVSVAAVSVVLGAANGLSNGLLMTLGADLAPPGDRVAFLGLWRVAHDSGTVVGPLVVAGVTATAGLAAASLASGGLAAAGAVIFARVVPRYLPRRTSDHGDDNRCPTALPADTIPSTT
ncbi:MAG: MFS transporter [Dietzia sp.]